MMTSTSLCDYRTRLWSLFMQHSKPLCGDATVGCHRRYLTEEGFRIIVDFLTSIDVLRHASSKENGTQYSNIGAASTAFSKGEVQGATAPLRSHSVSTSGEGTRISFADGLRKVNATVDQGPQHACSSLPPEAVNWEVLCSVQLQSAILRDGDTQMIETHAISEAPLSSSQVGIIESQRGGGKAEMQPSRMSDVSVGELCTSSNDGNQRPQFINVVGRSPLATQRDGVQSGAIDISTHSLPQPLQKPLQTPGRSTAVCNAFHCPSGTEGESSSFLATGLDAVLSFVKSDKTSCFSDMALDPAALDQLLSAGSGNGPFDRASDRVFMLIEKAVAQQESLHNLSRVRFFPPEGPSNSSGIKNGGPRVSTPPNRPRNPGVIRPPPYFPVVEETFGGCGILPGAPAAASCSLHTSAERRRSSICGRAGRNLSSGRHKQTERETAAGNPTVASGSAFQCNEQTPCYSDPCGLKSPPSTCLCGSEARKTNFSEDKGSIEAPGSEYYPYAPERVEHVPQSLARTEAVKSFLPRPTPQLQAQQSLRSPTLQGRGLTPTSEPPERGRRVSPSRMAALVGRKLEEWKIPREAAVPAQDANARSKGHGTFNLCNDRRSNEPVADDPRRTDLRPAAHSASEPLTRQRPNGVNRDDSAPCTFSNVAYPLPPPRLLSKRARTRAARNKMPTQPPDVPRSRVAQWTHRSKRSFVAGSVKGKQFQMLSPQLNEKEGSATARLSGDM